MPFATFGLQEAMPEVAKDMPASEKDMKPIAGLKSLPFDVEIDIPALGGPKKALPKKK